MVIFIDEVFGFLYMHGLTTRTKVILCYYLHFHLPQTFADWPMIAHIASLARTYRYTGQADFLTTVIHQ